MKYSLFSSKFTIYEKLSIERILKAEPETLSDLYAVSGTYKHFSTIGVSSSKLLYVTEILCVSDSDCM